VKKTLCVDRQIRQNESCPKAAFIDEQELSSRYNSRIPSPFVSLS
jgi:hypothetical protein